MGKAGLVAKWLFKKGKFVVLYELFEMLIIPVLNILVGIITLDFKKIFTSLATIAGRLFGLVKGLFYKFV